MALLHEATIQPSKRELIEPWLRTRPWWDGIDERGPVAAFRLDDPAGEVGIECFLYGSAAGSTLFVPVTYRAAPLAGAEAALIGTMEHSVLGTRYVYDACADPVFVATVLDTIRSGGRQADLVVALADGTEEVLEPRATAQGDGDTAVASHDPAAPVSPREETDRSVVHGEGFELTVMRKVGESPSGAALVGSFPGGAGLRLVVVSG